MRRAGAKEQVLVVTLERAERANAYTSGMLRALENVLEEFAGEPSIRGAVLTGEGSVFCAGADLDELGSAPPERALSLLSRRVFDAWAQAPWPTAAAINGPAVAGGFELALACDIRVASPAAIFRLPEASLGLLPAAGGIRRLVAELGPARAKELVLLGKQLDVHMALQWGLISEVSADPIARAIESLSVSVPDPQVLTVGKMLINQEAKTLHDRDSEGIAQTLFYSRRGSHGC